VAFKAAATTAREICQDELNKAVQEGVDARWILMIGGKIRHLSGGTTPSQIPCYKSISRSTGTSASFGKAR